MAQDTEKTENTKIAVLRMLRKTRRARLRILIGCILAAAFAVYMVIGFGEQRLNKLGLPGAANPNNPSHPNSTSPAH